MGENIYNTAKRVAAKIDRYEVIDLSILNKNTREKLIGSIYPIDGEVTYSHGTNHIFNVMNLAEMLLQDNIEKFKNENEIKTLYMAIILHDCTRNIDKMEHEESAALFINVLMRYSMTFNAIISDNNIDVNLMKEAIREHRASYKGEFSSPISELLSSADRGNPESLDDRITRSFNYAKEHGKNDHDAWMHAIDHMKEKFGRNGYQKLPKMYVDFFKDKIEKLWDDIDKLDYNYNHPCNKMREE